MHMRPKWVKDLASVVFTLYYLVCAEQADEMVRRVRGGLTLAHLRVSWDKPNTPYVSAFTALMRPKMMKYPPRQLRIPRPSSSSYTAPINAWLYFDGPIKSLKQQTRIVLDIPGGGFVAMDPRCHDDKLMAWAAKLGIPILALDYGKAPEYPYPYALNECYDAYHSLITSRGQVIGLAGTSGVPQIVVSGDSAGGNLAVGLMCMLLTESPHAPDYTSGDRTSRETPLPIPQALVLVYPALDMNIRNWMTDEQMALIKAPERRRTNKMVLTRKSGDYRRLTPDTPHGSGDEDDGTPPPAPTINPTISTPSSGKSLKNEPTTSSPTTTTTNPTPLSSKPPQTKPNRSQRTPAAQPTTRLAMSSMISYFADRILSPEMLRAMIILYIGPHSKPDFATDHLLSPILCPEALLAKFPKTYFLTGERDPLVDDTVVFAGRLRQAKEMLWRERREMGLVGEGEAFEEARVVEVLLIPGVSHGFLQFVSLFPEGRGYILQCARWMKDAFRRADEREAAAGVSRGQTPVEEGSRRVGSGYFGVRSVGQRGPRNHRRRPTDGFEGDDRPLEMSASLSMTSTLPSNGARRGSRAQGSSNGRGAVKKTPFSGRHSPIATRRSLVRLGSTEDLMGRRMHGLTGNLMGMGENMPFTP
ncbi:hypothetical protein LTR74_015409 [Friedmanniomyces endolithicus]|nr:hypothetical protein LTR74_015409 [Friedmanniomyces endolithicus]